MPLVPTTKGLVLKCINHALHQTAAPGETGTTMLSFDGWSALIRAYPPSPTAPDWLPRQIRYDASHGYPVKCFACSVCGYMELYYGPAVEPETWGRATHG